MKIKLTLLIERVVWSLRKACRINNYYVMHNTITEVSHTPSRPVSLHIVYTRPSEYIIHTKIQ